MDTTCVDKCPRTYLPDANNVCYMASEQTYPFISMVMTLVILIIVAVSYCLNKDTDFVAVFMGLESCAMVVFWIYMLAFLIRDGHRASSVLVSCAIFANFVINYLWWEYYNDKLHKLDPAFQQFCEMYPRTSLALKILALITNFDIFRLAYSGLFDLP